MVEPFKFSPAEPVAYELSYCIYESIYIDHGIIDQEADFAETAS
jgi:hypothetical protein